MSLASWCNSCQRLTIFLYLLKCVRVLLEMHSLLSIKETLILKFRFTCIVNVCISLQYMVYIQICYLAFFTFTWTAKFSKYPFNFFLNTAVIQEGMWGSSSLIIYKFCLIDKFQNIVCFAFSLPYWWSFSLFKFLPLEWIVYWFIWLSCSICIYSGDISIPTWK